MSIQLIREKQDLRHLSWSLFRASSGTDWTVFSRRCFRIKSGR